jgi:Na+-driven multidrug efflux pump
MISKRLRGDCRRFRSHCAAITYHQSTHHQSSIVTDQPTFIPPIPYQSSPHIQASSLGQLALPYLRFRGIAAVAVTVLASLEGISRGHGDTYSPFLSSLFAGVANFCLDPLLMFGMGMKLGGAALATSIAQFAGTLYLFRTVWIKRKEMLSIPTKDRTRTWRDLARTAGTILAANSAVLVRTTSLLGCWAVGTAVW